MALRFEWDPEKAAGTLAKHEISFEEAATVFGDRLGRMVDDPRHSTEEPCSILLGYSERGHLLAVMFTERAEAIRLISARKATRRERRAYEAGQR